MFCVLAAYAASSALLPMVFFVVLGAFDACAYAAYDVYTTFAACSVQSRCLCFLSTLLPFCVGAFAVYAAYAACSALLPMLLLLLLLLVQPCCLSC